MKSTMSILGLIRANEKIFDDFVVPNGINKEILVNNIISEFAELEILYTNPDFMQYMIGIWSKKELPVWEKLYNTTILEYDPIENYNRFEDFETNIENNNAGKNNGDNSSQTEHSVQGFNSADYVKESKDVGSGNYTDNFTTNGNSKENRMGHMHGNIGVTTTQQMIEQERNVSMFNIYDFITKSFKNRFCLLVY